MTAVIRTYRPGEEKYVADLHERLYAEEYGWGPAFVTYAKEIALDFPRRPEKRPGRPLDRGGRRGTCGIRDALQNRRSVAGRGSGVL